MIKAIQRRKATKAHCLPELSQPHTHADPHASPQSGSPIQVKTTPPHSGMWSDEGPTGDYRWVARKPSQHLGIQCCCSKLSYGGGGGGGEGAVRKRQDDRKKLTFCCCWSKHLTLHSVPSILSVLFQINCLSLPQPFIVILM